MAILAIDPGTACGFALLDGDRLTSGVWDLSPGRGRPHKTKWLNLWAQLELAAATCKLTRIVHEEVFAHRNPGGGTNIYAAHCYGAIVAVLQMWAEWRGAEVSGVGVSQAKKAATGKGNASKAQVLAAMQERWPEQNVTDSNQADALAVLMAATQTGKA